jgi:integrase
MRPVIQHAEYQKLMEVAPSVNKLLAVPRHLAGETGRRLSALRQLRWCDVELEGRTIDWRPANDKRGVGGQTPISPELLLALTGLRDDAEPSGSGWVLPAPGDSRKACSRHRLDRWLRTAYAIVELTPKKGGLWHPI